MLFEFLSSILQEKLFNMNKLMKEMYQLSNSNNINVRYKKQSHIARKFIILIHYYGKEYFVRHFLQVTR